MTAPAPRTEVAIGLVIDAGRVLITRRPAHVPLGGQWEFPGGKIEPGETPEAAAERELREELAITATALSRLPAIQHDYPHARITLIPVLCHHTAGHPQPIGCSEFRPVALPDLSTYTFPPANATLLHTLASTLLHSD